MAQLTGWQSFWWLNTALLGFVTICCIFLFPETKYDRRSTTVNDLANNLPTTSGSTEQTDTEAVSAKDSSSPPRVYSEPETGLHQTQDPWLGRGRPSKAQWRFAQPYSGNILAEFCLPWKLFCFPIIQFSAFVVSWSASVFLTVNLTQSQAFANPPYNFSSTKIGFFNFATLIGALIGLFTAGPLSDIVAVQLTKRHSGIREPEMRLLAMIPYIIIMVIGNVVVAVGYQQSWDWKVYTPFQPT
jgi:hypothetical protein